MSNIGTINFCVTKNTKVLFELSSFIFNFNSIEFSAGINFIIRSYNDNTTKFFDARTGKLQYTFFSAESTDYLVSDNICALTPVVQDKTNLNRQEYEYAFTPQIVGLGNTVLNENGEVSDQLFLQLCFPPYFQVGMKISVTRMYDSIWITYLQLHADSRKDSDIFNTA